jgi:hypothetical protein
VRAGQDRAILFGLLLEVEPPDARILAAREPGATGVSLRLGSIARSSRQSERRAQSAHPALCRGLTDFPRWASWAACVAVPQRRVEVSLATRPRDFAEGADALVQLARECGAHGVALEVARRRRAFGDFRFVPAAPHHSGKTSPPEPRLLTRGRAEMTRG